MNPPSILREALHEAAARAEQPPDLLAAVRRRTRRHRRRTATGIVAAAVCLAVAATAFGPGVVRRVTDPGLGRIPIVSRTQDFPNLPLNRYITTTEQNTTILTALRIETRVCMARFGFADFHGADIVNGENESERVYAGTFYMINAADAQKYGYHVTPPSWTGGNDDTPHGAGALPALAPHPDGDGIAPPADSAAATAVFSGDSAGTSVNGQVVPVGGCVVAAGRMIDTRGVDSNTYDVGEPAGNIPGARAYADRRVKDAMTAWSTCMADAGYFYSDFDQPYLLEPYWNDLVKTEKPVEIADSTTNVACKAKTNVIGIVTAVIGYYEQQFIDAYPKYFAAVVAYTRAIVARCAEITAAGRPIGAPLTLAAPPMPALIKAYVPD